MAHLSEEVKEQILSAFNKIPTWTTATRPADPEPGQLGLNLDTQQIECFNGTEWVILG